MTGAKLTTGEGAWPPLARCAARTQPLVLVADDDEVECFLVTEALEEAGFAVAAEADGEAALAAARRLRPDVILLDVVMPKMDGYEVCATLRRESDFAHVPVLMVTGADDVESIEKAFDAGATDFMSKPINWTILSHRVRYMFRASSAVSELRASQMRLAEAQKIAHLGSWEWEAESGRFACSEETRAIFGFEPSDPPKGLDDLLARLDEDDRSHLRALIDGALQAARGFDVDSRVLLPDGSERILAVKADAAGGAGGRRLTGTFQDITERKQIEARIHYLAYHDSLTNLPNRMLYRDRLEQALARARRDKTMVAVLCLDLDHFKEVNDTLGHVAGDALLRAASNRIQEVVRGSDTVARLGGDEFAVTQVGLGQPDGAVALAARLIEAISRPFEIDGHETMIGCSIGISVFPDDCEDAEQLIMNADIALYRVKAEGRGAYRCFETGMEQSLRARKALEQDLRQALDQGWFELHYQPQFTVQDLEVVGAEALLRLRHPEQGLISPADFIPLAEQTGLIVPIGDWVIRSACAQLAAWQAQGLTSIRVAVNVSPAQFRQGELLSTVASALDEAGLAAGRLEVEITESILMQNTAETLDVLRKLHGLGVRIAMDDFGTGYSSLNYLRLFAFDRIKIDRCFIESLGRDQEAGAIVRSILALGKSLNMQTTAEGVETQQQFSYLKGESCDEVQGFLFGRPQPAEDFPAELTPPVRRAG